MHLKLQKENLQILSGVTSRCTDLLSYSFLRPILLPHKQWRRPCVPPAMWLHLMSPASNHFIDETILY